MEKEQINISKGSLLITILSFPLSFCYFAVLRFILSKKFFLDEITIRKTMKPGALENDYSATGDFYKAIGFHWDTPVMYEMILSAAVFFLFTIFLVFILKIDFSDLGNLIWYGVCMMGFGLYVSMISKDLIVFIFLLATAIFIKKRIYIGLFIGIILTYASIYREYWFITIGLTLILYIFYKYVKKHKVFFFILISNIYLIVISVMYHDIKHSYFSATRQGINGYRTNDIYSRTMTKTLFPPTNIINDLLNTLYNGINLLIPIDGFGSANELVYYIWLYSVLYLIWYTYKKYNGINGNVWFYLLFYFSFIFTQSLFEPDMGSAFRHQLMLSIFIPFFLFYYRDSKEKY